jgi:hypothetical protein
MHMYAAVVFHLETNNCQRNYVCDLGCEIGAGE